MPVVTELTPEQRAAIEQRFRELEAIWLRETGHLSSSKRIRSHHAYSDILQLGEPVVPLMLRDGSGHCRRSPAKTPCALAIDFYLGTIWVAQRADLTPVYEMIFRRLKALGLNWHYHWDEEHRETWPADASPPDIVVAYQDVYGRLPRRWPATDSKPTATTQ